MTFGSLQFIDWYFITPTSKLPYSEFFKGLLWLPVMKLPTLPKTCPADTLSPTFTVGSFT